jgi:hypothetical protein
MKNLFNDKKINKMNVYKQVGLMIHNVFKVGFILGWNDAKDALGE